MTFEQLTTNFFQNPRRLFVIDGFGAILSAILLGIVLVKLERIFGIPESTLYFLASLPIFFAIYDFHSYRQENYKLSKLLKGIAILNLLYCLLSIGFLIFHHQTITLWGWAYIITEVIIVIALANLELRIANRLKKSNLKKI